MAPIVVIGASLAGLSAVEAMRDAGHDGEIVVVEASSRLPSDRPPLSKQVLSGEWEPDKAAQPAARELGGLRAELRFGVRAVALDIDRRTVTLSDGSRIEAGGIVLAMGASPRTLPGDPLEGVHVLRDLDECLALRADLDRDPKRVVVIGAGFIGAEVAATCRGRGHDVTMIEALPQPMSRVLPLDIGRFVAQVHREEGVDVRLGVGVDGLDSTRRRVTGVRLADGSSIEAEVVVVGIGVAPNIGWLDGSGLTIGNGVVCDATTLAAPGIVAAGDLAWWPNPHFGEEMRVEHWEHAIEQGAHAGRRLLADLAGEPGEEYSAVPWFWSDQYGCKIQMAGRPAADDRCILVEGDYEQRRFVVAFRRGEACTGVLGVSRPRHVMQGRMRLVESLDWAPIDELFAG
jgi:3-phenylpropionate/trans-cinnamate dioxygenase ferredoxin reductase subunit